MLIVMVTAFPTDPHRIDGGVAGVAKYLVDELKKQPNTRLTIVVPKAPVRETTCERLEGLEVYRVAKKRLCSFLPGTFYDIFVGKRQLRSLLRELHPDITHFQGATFLAADCEQPHILTIHGIMEKDAIWDKRWGVFRWLKYLLLKLTEDYGRRRVPYVILISEYAKTFLPKKNKIHKTWLINNPIADSYFNVEWKPESGRIFCCSRIRPLKNIVGMIKAFALIVERFPESQLRIAGTAERTYLETCQRQVVDHDLGAHVHFLGNLSISEIQLELSRANCLAIPSFQENAPLVVEEAMAVGVPVVAARVGGIPEMVENGGTGFLADPYSTNDIAEAVCRVFSNQKLARSMSEQAKRIARKRYMASAICNRTLEAYKEILLRAQGC